MTHRDDGHRARARSDAGSSLIVEASAGTGKTTTLISRIVHLVVEEGFPLREIAAMTFTEKAAGDMKTKLRGALDEVLAKRPEGDRKVRAERATFDLDAAEVSTIHSFCARLLRERPVEAGVDPDFVAGDELLASDLAAEVYRDWFDAAARRDPGPVPAALRAGATPQAIRDLAFELHDHRLLLAEAELPTDPGNEIRELAGRLRATYERILPSLSSKENAKRQTRVEEVLEELRIFSTANDEALRGAAPSLKIDLHGKWPEEVKETVLDSRPDVKTLEDLLSAFPFVPILTSLVEEIRTSFFAVVHAAKRRDGLLDFDDLLLHARDLLRTSRAAREHFHAKYRTLVVDEFQDTDPVQAEIVMRLAAPPEPQGRDWTSLSPTPGRLFIVGDPKQSIYRFRRADIETYARTRKRFPPDNRLVLSSNFRSSKPLLDFVNHVGPGLLPGAGGADYAAPYEPLEPSDRTKAAKEPAVLFLAPPPPDPGGDEEREGDDLTDRAQEARAVANLLLLDRFSGREKPWSRIAVLVPRNDTIRLLEEAFTEAGIPYVLEGGKSYYRREEVAAVVLALRAIENPTDGIAVVGALKSFLFGVSDRRLQDAVEAGARFEDPMSVEETSPLFAALELLHRLHRMRHARSAAGTLSELLSSRQAMAAIENGAVVHPLQGLANLERLLAFVRDLDREGLSFPEAVARVVRRTDEEAAEPAAFTEESEAVRLMTLYKAKGLEFDVVVLADFGLKPRNGAGGVPPLVWDLSSRRFGTRLGFGAGLVRSARFTEVEETDRLRRDEEVRRLLYVGLTRAKETLVVSWFRRRTVRKRGGVTDRLGNSLLFTLAPYETLSAALPRLVETVPADLSTPARRPTAPEREEPVDVAARMAEADERLERARVTASRPLRRAGEKDSAFTVTAEDTEPSDRDEAPDRARRIGVAVHVAMEALLKGTTMPDAAATRNELKRAGEALFEDERREASDLVNELLAKPVVARAFAAVRRFVEMPILYVDASRPDRPLVEGKIDLLFEEADGWQIVDWKTDRVASSADRLRREELYAPQIRAYEEGLRKLLGPDAAVKGGLLVFARPLTA